jgi:hypothetical protein
MTFASHRVYGGSVGTSLARPTTERRVFLVDGQPYRVQRVTAFKLLELFRQGSDIRPFIRYHLELGFREFRVLVNKPPVPSLGEPGWDTPSVEVLLAFMHEMQSEGARAELTLFGSKLDPGFVQPYTIALRDHCPHAYLEGINEPGHEGQWENTDTIDGWVLPMRGDLPYASGNYDPQRAMRGSFANVHTDRAAEPCETSRKAKSVLEMYDGWTHNPDLPISDSNYDYAGFHHPWVGDEPGKPSDLGNHLPAIEAMFAIYGLLGAGGCAHTLGGQFGRMPTADEDAYLRAAIRGLTAFSASAPNDGNYWHDTEDEKVTGSLRTYRCGQRGVRVCPKDGSSIIINGDPT